MINLMKYTGLFLILVFVSGCASNQVSLSERPQLLHFSTPEASGGFGEGDIALSLSIAQPEYMFGTLTVSNRPPNTITGYETSVDKVTQSLNLSLRAGILKYLDFYVDSNAIIGLKYQLLGSPRDTKQTGLKFAVAAKAGSTHHAEPGIFSDSPHANAQSQDRLLDISANLGYRYNPKLIAYLNTFINKNDFSGELWLDGSGIYRTVSASSKSFGFLVGYQFDTDTNGFFNLEIGSTRTIWDNRETTTAFPIGVRLGRHW